MRFRVLEDIGDSIFPRWDTTLNSYIQSYLDTFATHTDICEVDIMEIIEYDILCELSMFYEYSEIYMIFNLYTKKYQDKYIAILEGLFLNNMIDFYIIDEPTQPTLATYKKDKYQAWIYFRDNFICKECFNAKDFCNTSWNAPSKWSRYNINVTITPKGTKYFNEILSPRFYEKYKDLEVEIDDKGNIVKWIGEIKR